MICLLFRNLIARGAGSLHPSSGCPCFGLGQLVAPASSVSHLSVFMQHDGGLGESFMLPTLFAAIVNFIDGAKISKTLTLAKIHRPKDLGPVFQTQMMANIRGVHDKKNNDNDDDDANKFYVGGADGRGGGSGMFVSRS